MGGGCAKDTNVRIVVDEQQAVETRKAYYEKLSNEEFGYNLKNKIHLH